jgi:hypothetical protein
MQVATLDDKEEVFVFEDHADLIDFLEWQKECVTYDLGSLIRSVVPYDRWDHYYGTCMRTIHSLALIKIRFGKAAPLFAHNLALTEYAEALFAAWGGTLERGTILVVNKNGGHQDVSEQRLSARVEYDLTAPQRLHIVEGSNVLILENDPELDQWTLANVPKGYSYITELRKFSETQLTDAMAAFCRQIPQGKICTLFVYTTGLDAEQMKSYVEVACGRGFTEFVFVESAGPQRCFDVARERIERDRRKCCIFDPADAELSRWMSLALPKRE